MLTQGAQYIHCEVASRDRKTACFMTVVYRFNTTDQRKNLWNDLKTLIVQCNKPWLMWGDFNALLYSQDRLYGAQVTSNETKDFANCVQALFLNKLLWKGEYYSWTNRTIGSNRIYSRLDRAMGNDEWMMQYGHLVLDYRLPHISDHSPMLLGVHLNLGSAKSPFRFFNV